MAALRIYANQPALEGAFFMIVKSSWRFIASSTGQRGLIKQHTNICIWLPSDLTWPHIAFVLVSHCVGWTSGHWNELAITANTKIVYCIEWNRILDKVALGAIISMLVLSGHVEWTWTVLTMGGVIILYSVIFWKLLHTIVAPDRIIKYWFRYQFSVDLIYPSQSYPRKAVAEKFGVPHGTLGWKSPLRLFSRMSKCEAGLAVAGLFGVSLTKLVIILWSSSALSASLVDTPHTSSSP